MILPIIAVLCTFGITYSFYSADTRTVMYYGRQNGRSTFSNTTPNRWSNSEKSPVLKVKFIDDDSTKKQVNISFEAQDTERDYNHYKSKINMNTNIQFWYLSHQLAARAKMILCILTRTLEPLLFKHIYYVSN